MQTEVTMAGFGGQGLMMIGKLLAYAGLEEGKEVTWLPSYGPEMRGGTANCTVVIGDKAIGSPLISYPEAALVHYELACYFSLEGMMDRAVIALGNCLRLHPTYRYGAGNDENFEKMIPEVFKKIELAEP